MKGSGIIFAKLHNIDHKTGKIQEIDLDSRSKELLEYLSKLIKDVKDADVQRKYEFRGETTEIHNCLKLMISGDIGTAVNAICARLLDVEIKAQEKIKHLRYDILKGSLFQSLIEIENDQYIVILAKVDQKEFLDTNDFELHSGFPWKEKIFKSFLAGYYDGEFTNMQLTDANTSTSKYWWSDFLELKPIRTDKDNTEKFLEKLDKRVLNPIKSIYPADHLILRNSIIGYFRSSEHFDLNELLDRVFLNHTPTDENLDIKKIASKVREIPKKYGVDSQYGIDKAGIKMKTRNQTVKLNEGMDLHITSPADLDRIKPFEDDEGEKYIYIKSEEGYRTFKK